VQCLLPTSQHRNYTQTESFVERYSVLESSLFGFGVQFVIQKATWLVRGSMKSKGTLIRVDLDLKNAFGSAGHSCIWVILEGFGVPDI